MWSYLQSKRYSLFENRTKSCSFNRLCFLNFRKLAPLLLLVSGLHYFGYIAPSYAPKTVKEIFFQNISSIRLPLTSQQQDRVLVAITLGRLGDSVRQLKLVLQLDYYLTLCEEGFEVHIIFITDEFDFNSNLFGFLHHSRFHCFRLGKRMEMLIWNRSVNPSRHLAAYHRRLFSDHLDFYDWFISQEDDMIIRPANFKYFIRFSPILEPFAFYPGFAIAEILPSQKTSHVWLPFHYSPDGFNTMNIANISGIRVMILYKPWVPAYILSKAMLRVVSAHSTWKGDELCDPNCGEVNVHFQHIWLTSFYKVAIPIDAIYDSFLHHSPDKYSSMVSWMQPQGRFVIIVEELVYLLQICAGGAQKPKFEFSNFSIEYKSMSSKNERILGPNPCLSCLQSGEISDVRVRFGGNMTRALEFHSVALEVWLGCISVAQQQMSFKYTEIEK